MSVRVLLTGAAGYIGSHTAVELLNAGYEVVIADSLINSDAAVIDAIEKISGKSVDFYQIDISDKTALQRLFSEQTIDAVIHFAGYKAVGESVQKPISYYRNNIDTTLALLEVMESFACKRIVFSSSATVYGEHGTPPFSEDMPTGQCTNPYGWTKYIIEQILTDAAKADRGLSVMLLRYFNPVGAHESGLIGERPNGIPNNLMPYIMQTAAGIHERLNVYGNDYPTPDGTGVRDYIHVSDLAKGHLAALHFSETHTGVEAVNLGTGCGYSVLEVVEAFERVNSVKVPYVIAPRRPGDVAVCYADARKAEKLLSWRAEKTLDDMCRDSWHYQQMFLKGLN